MDWWLDTTTEVDDLPLLTRNYLNLNNGALASRLLFWWRKEETEMKAKLIAGFLLAGSCLFAAPRITIGVGVGLGAPVPAYGYYAPVPAYAAPAYVPPPAPGPGYTWVAGYWYGAGPNRVWRPGYWATPRTVYFGPRGHFRR